jgi:hypothetical protein
VQFTVFAFYEFDAANNEGMKIIVDDLPIDFFQLVNDQGAEPL